MGFNEHRAENIKSVIMRSDSQRHAGVMMRHEKCFDCVCDFLDITCPEAQQT